jgi:UDP-N-acetylenolpyruvoylglucosamine reductase
MQVKELNKAKIGFEYCNTYFQKHTNNIVLKAWFQRQTTLKVEMKNKMEELKSKRWEKHADFIVNIGNATGQDVLAVISEVHKRVVVRMGNLGAVVMEYIAR